MNRTILAALLLLLAGPVLAQGRIGLVEPVPRNEPVTFTADEVEFDQATDTVSARGRVEAWQGQRMLRADRFTFHRGTGIATAEGNIVMIEPDGQIFFADRAELAGGMRDAVIEGLRGLLAENTRIAAAGGRRTEGRITDMARLVYSPCELCPEDPTRPPLWQLRARIASLHADEQRVRYRDVFLDIAGVPVLYAPYLSHAAPGAPRVSGFLAPTIGASRLLGGFWEQPFYWAIDEHSDATISSTISTRQYGNLGFGYRRRFNTGLVTLDGSLGWLETGEVDQRGVGWNIRARGFFDLDENWRFGAVLDRASSRDYMRAYRFGAPQLLTSTAFLEGFWGAEGYARLDARAYQALLARVGTGTIPFVLPFGFAEWVFPRDELGGRLTLDTQGYSLWRSNGTDSRRLATRAGYELPMLGRFGEIWTLRGRTDLLAGWSQRLAQAPFFGPAAEEDGAWTNANFRGAMDLRWPLLRAAGDWGSQLIEPRVQLVGGPNTGRQLRIPAEDSLDLEFSDATLFELNRFPGRDLQEGGSRMDAAMRAAWLFPNGGQVEGLVGRSFRASSEALFPPGSGLDRQASDWVGRARLAPVPWFELLGRTRLDGESGEPRLWDVSGTVFTGRFSLTAGYLGSDPPPNTAYRKRDEASLGGVFRVNEHWRLGAFGRYDRALERPVAAQLALTYEDECLIFEARYVRRWVEEAWTQRELPGATMLLFRVTLKTIGDFGIRAL